MTSVPAYGHAAIILIVKTLLFIGILHKLCFSEMFYFEQENREHPTLEALPLLPKQIKSNFQTFKDWLSESIVFVFTFVGTSFRIFYLVWFCFNVLPLPPLLYIAGVISCRYLLPFLEFSKGVKKSTVNVMSEVFAVFREFINVFPYIVRKTKVMNTEAGLLYFSVVFIRGLVCIVLYIVFLTLLTLIIFNCPYSIFVKSILTASLSSLRIAGGIVAERRVKCVSFVQISIASRLLQFLSYIALCFGI